MILADLLITLLARLIAIPVVVVDHILPRPKQQPRQAECWEPGETRPCTGCPAGVCRWFPDMAVTQ